ncbi:MAG: hypothetical protein J6T57_01950 [Alphaproteobacteria bacterium]|nr:hypothetical protein [Alphaproteobacteria bacterium]
MKGFKILFGVCLGVLACWGANATDSDDVARAAVRGVATTGTQNSTQTAGRATPTASKITNTTSTRATGTGTVSRERTNTATESRTTKNVTTRTVQPTNQRTNVVARPSNITQRNTATNTAQRATSPSRTAARTAIPARATTNRNSRGGNIGRPSRTAARVATTESVIPNANYSKCREIFYECMDEFCANKDANLRRCACSARANEFDGIKKQMERVEDKMLDFNQRLLTVNMDAADATAINTATEGENAFYGTQDKTKSKRALDDIAKKLNATFGEDANGTSLSPITWSLNIDSAFDTVDSMMGAQTTSKSGVALYNAALPVCRDIATEVCSEDEISLATGGYLMQIEQDCNTVHKSYQSQADTARAKVFESSALLDMSRLDAYQTRNSDDILTCKSKMLEMLTDTTVCGANMEKCLDVTGKYIDPTTGAAFLTENLADLDNMIMRPTTNQTWTSANSSSAFLTYLKNKKNYLISATTNCRDIADSVWDGFIEDALSQIKLAQTAKIEEMRRACTTLTAECINTATDSITEFDARALSVFGVAADYTVNTMCADVRTACTRLMATSPAVDDENPWQTGTHEIMTSKTYETIKSSCTQVGRNCIIQSCKSISGNFGLCNDIYTSPNRHSILERTACWPEVQRCVASAGDQAILDIMANLGKYHPDAEVSENTQYNETDNPLLDTLYDKIYTEYHNNPTPGYRACDAACDPSKPNYKNTTCATCLIAESIWGNCDTAPSLTENDSNQIWQPDDGTETLLYWFAVNTGTHNKINSCVNVRCSANNYVSNASGGTTCASDTALEDALNDPDNSDITLGDMMYCPTRDTNGNPLYYHMQISTDITNCCFDGASYWHHTWISPNACCEGTIGEVDHKNICLPVNINGDFKPVAKSGTKYLVCVGDNEVTGETPTNNSNYPGGTNIRCNGRFVLIDTNNNDYSNPIGTSGQYNVRNVYYDNNTHSNPIDANGALSWFIHYDNP